MLSIFWKRLCCTHEWKILSEITTKSAVEVLRDSGVARIQRLEDPTSRKIIQIFSCDKCGKIKKFVEKV